MPRRPKAPAPKKWRERQARERDKWNRYPTAPSVKKPRTVGDDRVKSRLPIIIDV